MAIAKILDLDAPFGKKVVLLLTEEEASVLVTISGHVTSGDLVSRRGLTNILWQKLHSSIFSMVHCQGVIHFDSTFSVNSIIIRTFTDETYAYILNPAESRVLLLLPQTMAELIVDLICSVGGDPVRGNRKYATYILDALCEAGIQKDFTRCSDVNKVHTNFKLEAHYRVGL